MSLPRHRSFVNSREPSAPPLGDLKSAIQEIDCLPGSSMLSAKEVDEIMQSTAKIVGDTNIEWIKRLNMLKTFRSLCSDTTHHTQIVAYLRHLMPPLQGAVKDLRSQVCREACITVAHLAQQLGLKAEFFFEPFMPALFSLLVANAKVVSLTGGSTIVLVYESIPSWRLLPPLQVQMQSKSKEVRRAVCMVLKMILGTWNPTVIQKHGNLFHEIMKKGLSDADAEARNSTREGFPAFQRVFPGLATSILDSLEPLQKRQLQSVLNQQSNNAPTPMTLQRTNGASHTGSLSRQGSIKKTSIPVLASRTPIKTTTSGRSASAIDLQAVNRAKQHHTVTSRSPLKYIGRTNSMASPATTMITHSSGYNTTSSATSAQSSAAKPTNDRSRTRSRISRLSQSQRMGDKSEI